MTRCFVAIDFETADYGRDFMFTYIHGIEWCHVANEPTFGRVWRDVQPLLAGAEFLAAHNASFDRSVLNDCCAKARITPPEIEFVCSMRLARSTWDLYPTKLPDVCQHLGWPLRHHDATFDAEAAPNGTSNLNTPRCCVF
jgi:DNA polymerase III subunit epsilon